MNSDSEILEKVERTIAGHGMMRRGDGVVAGLSGGPDSVCLLHVLHRLGALLGIRLVAAHFDHGLRPAEDENETRFVTGLARSLNIPVDGGKWASSQIPGKGSMEERARDARYRFLEAARRKFACRRIALGHTLDDQAETVLIRLLRGSGPAGLSGIPPRRKGGIIRPLIDIRRSDIESYLARNGLSYVTDSSNADQRILRNRIRLELLPVLTNYQPRIIENLARTARIMRDDEDWMAGTAAEWLNDSAEQGENHTVRIPVAAFNRLHRSVRNRVIRLALERAAGTLRRVDAGHVEAVNRLAAGSRPQARLDLPNNATVARTYGHLVFATFSEAAPIDFSYTIGGPGIFRLEAIQRNIALTVGPAESRNSNENAPRTARLDADRVAFPLTVRNPRPGDRFIPLGMSGHKKVKDFFIDLKIPASDRLRTPILLQGNDIVWICGYRIDERVKVTPDTRRVLRVTMDE